ncbi:MAG: glycosyltransferase family 25 protein [Polaribacter sp.]|jgi:glycosyl transferase family 25
MSSYKFYYINLDKSTDRKDFMEDQFAKFGIDIERFSATYGKSLDIRELRNHKKGHQILAHFPYPNDGEIGICLTHFELWKSIANQKEDFAIVLEDDALVNEDLFRDLEDLLADLKTDEFLDISGKKGFYPLTKTESFCIYLMPPVLMIGQIIGKEAAKKLSQNLPNYYAPIDVMKQDVYKHQVPLKNTIKSYVKTNDFNIGGTTIQQRGLPIYKKIIRELVRPFWQIFTLFTYKFRRCFLNYRFYKKRGII